jgi:FKBP-type peptidyl-prolyl cis-trans isomerase
LIQGDNLTTHYTGRFVDGVVFETSRESKPISGIIGIGNFIRGWDEGVLTMSLGERAEIVMSPAYAYGSQGYEDAIPPNSTLIFDVLNVY